MGRQGNERRKQEKKLLRDLGFRENEFGEVVKTVTKAEARRQLLRKEAACIEIIDRITILASQDISSSEDARVWAEIDCIGAISSAVMSPI